MTYESLKAALIAVVQDNMAFAAPLVFAMGFAEGIPGLSLLVPSSALFLGIGAVHGAAGGSFWQVWLGAATGAVISDCFVYMLARHYGEGVQQLPLFRRHANWLDRGQAILRQWGALAVLGGKFTGFMRPFIPAVAGLAGMPFKLFLPASVVSSLAWAGAFLAPGYGVSWWFG